MGDLARPVWRISRTRDRLLPLSGELHDVGYGDLLLTPAWRLLGPLEATNGALMFGVSAAMVFAAVQRLVLARFEDLRN